jgi:ABC-type transport system involved in multi-copper enzyme maturation permease subunit
MNAVWELTWKELIRKRVTLMTAIMTVLFWIAYWLVANAVSSETDPLLYISTMIPLVEKYAQASIILTVGFFFGAFALAFLSIFSAVAAITGEAEHGVLQSVLARPLPRWQWFIGRWLGFVSYVVVYALILFISIVGICWIETGLLFEWQVLLRSLLLFVSVVPLLVSLTMLGSCWLGPLGNGIGMTMLFGMGWLGSTIARLTSAGRATRMELNSTATLDTITGLIKLVMPADALQQRMLNELLQVSELYGLMNTNRLQSLFSSGEVPSDSFLIYSALYTVIIFIAGILVFRRRDF